MSERGLLTLVQWLSPAFPLGSFAWSQGLEWAMSDGGLRDRAGLEAWIGDLIDHGSLAADAVLLARSLDAGADHAALADRARALAPTRERLAEMLKGLGATLAEVVEPFRPEGGAYGHGRTLGHDHGHDHGHDRDQGKDHDHGHDHGARHVHTHVHRDPGGEEEPSGPAANA